MDSLIHNHHADKKLRQYLNNLDEATLMKSIRWYQRQDRRRWTADKLQREIYRILTPPRENSFMLFPRAIQFTAGQLLFRARRLESEGQITQVENVMHAPTGAAPGRLNKANESLLYTACDIGTALREVRAVPGDLVSIAQFSVLRDIQCTYLGETASSKALPLKLRRKENLILNFLATVISQRDTPYGHPDYNETEYVVKNLFDYPPQLFAGWAYPSFANQNAQGTNVTFRPDQAENSVVLTTVVLANLDVLSEAGTTIDVFKKMHPCPDGSLRPDKSFSSVASAD